MSKTGRPPKFTPEVRATLLKSLETVGMTYEAASGSAGISYKTFRLWQLKGEEAEKKLDAGDELTSEERKFLDFFHAVEISALRARAKLETLFFRGAIKDWRAAKEFLARRYPKDWGDKVDIDLGDTVIEINLTPPKRTIEESEEASH